MRQAIRAAWLGIGLSLLIGAALPSAAEAGPYSRLQVLLPGETAAPGTGSGKTGTPRPQVVGIPFTITVNACDNTWTTNTTVTNTIQILSSDASATLPSNAQLISGTRTFTVTLNAAGSFTMQAKDMTDGTIPNGTSASVSVQVLSGFTFEAISQKHKYAGVDDATTLTARDPNGNVVTGYTGPVGLKEITSYGDGRVTVGPAHTSDTVTLTNGVWTGNIRMYRADETSINRGNVNKYAYDLANPSKNGTSDPFIVHPGPLTRVQIVVPGETPLPGSVSGKTGSPATQAVGTGFVVNVYSTDAYWNPLPSAATVQVTATGSSNTPLSGALSNGTRQFTVTLNTVGSQTVSVSSSGLTGMTSPPIQVIPAGVARFAFNQITGSLTAGIPASITIRAVDSGGNTVPSYAADAILTSNTGTGSVSPSQVTFSNGTWTGDVTMFGAGGAVALTCADYSAPPKTGTSNNFVVNPGPYSKLQVILPGESPQGGTATGKTGMPTPQTAGNPFTITVRAVDQFWNMVPSVSTTVGLTSTDTFAWMPPETTLVNGQVLVPVRLHKSGQQTITATDSNNGSIQPNTSSPVLITGGPFARVLVLAPGEFPAPGTVTGRGGTATDQSINYAFTVTVLATDQWWNPVTTVGAIPITHTVRITSGDPLAQLPPDQAMVDGRADMVMRLSTGGFQLISASDVTDPSKTGSTTQVRAISSGFHLEATIGQATAQAGFPFTLTVRVVNDAGSVIQEFNSSVTVEVQNATTGAPGRGVFSLYTFQLTQGEEILDVTYTFAEPILLIVRDNAGNTPGTSPSITILPGPPSAVRLTSNPPWVGGNKHALLTARVVDDFENGVPDRLIAWSLLSGTGTLTALTDTTNAAGEATADFLSPRNPEIDRIRATSGGLFRDLDLETAFVDPTAGGGYVSNYPNPFHAGTEPTTIAYKLGDHASVILRIFTTTGSLVRREVFDRGAPGGMAGLNEWVWDGKNGKGDVVASGGYVLMIEAQGQGETLHVIRRKIAVVR